jgi:hypothetical protein
MRMAKTDKRTNIDELRELVREARAKRKRSLEQLEADDDFFVGENSEP